MFVKEIVQIGITSNIYLTVCSNHFNNLRCRPWLMKILLTHLCHLSIQDFVWIINHIFNSLRVFCRFVKLHQQFFVTIFPNEFFWLYTAASKSPLRPNLRLSAWKIGFYLHMISRDFLLYCPLLKGLPFHSGSSSFIF